ESSLWQLGWPGGIPSYGSVEIAPGRPANEVEFWYALTALAARRDYNIPEFLRRLPLPEGYAERLAEMERAQRIRQWTTTLRSVPARSVPATSAQAPELRFRFGPAELAVETRSGEGSWRAVKLARSRDFDQEGAIRFAGESQVLWASFFQHVNFYGSHDRSLGDAHLSQWLSRHLRAPAFADLFVDTDGSPLVRHQVPLQWRISEPDQPGGDYVFELTQANGEPVSKIRARFPGEPELYLTEAGLFPGPPALPFPVKSREPIRIPAGAFETASGLRVLDWIRTAPPPRLSERIKVVSVTPKIEARLIQSTGAGGSEYCHLKVSADSGSGRHRHGLNEAGWYEVAGAAEAPNNLVRIDRSALAGIPELVRETGFKLDAYAGHFAQRVTKTFPAQFLEFLSRLPAGTRIELSPELESLRQGRVAGTLRLEANEAGLDWFDLSVVVNVDDTTLTPEEIKLLVAARGQWVRLGERGWRRLDYELTSQEESDLARIGLTPRQLSAEPQRLHALQLADPAARRFLPAETSGAVERRAAELKARLTPAQPATVQAELRPYQLDGFHFLAYLAANRFGGVLADDMGLGKTLQTLTWLMWLREEGAIPQHRTRPSLVVCPKSVQDNWRAEAERFCRGLRAKVWTGTAAQDLGAMIDAADLHVINYTQLRLLEDSIGRCDFLAAILDEGQYIKNPSSQTAQVARTLRADYRLVLTGTPIENRLLDLWSLMSFAMPGVLGGRSGFSKLYDGKDDPFARPRLAARVRPFLLRRTKAQVARDLPDRVEEDLYCSLEGEQKSLYRAELKAAQQHLLRLKTQEALNKDRFHLLTSLLRLRQICCHPRLLKPDCQQDGAKLEALLETLEPLIEEGEKVLVFSQFVELLGLLKEAITARGWAHWYLAGDTENRGELVQKFQSAEGAGVFLISLKAGGAGLNLTAAGYVVLFDPWWNPAVENQAIDRTHRIGQTRKIIAYRLLIKDSIEEKIRALQKQKGALAEEVLGEERFSAALTLDDLRFLLAD
ncbi:MAG TPA: serine/threonine protein phosphatase, partial [Verrucomicrobiales bacterium]|nr:serine/threonine protein phosphatase [Verrucomicrobiales bacterium]